jgi:hypothetical protein
MRMVLTASRAPTHFWLLALRNVGEQRLRRQLQALGVATPELWPFGLKAMVKQKLWQKRDDTLKHPMQKLSFLEPAADMATTSLGYYAQSDETGKFFRSTVVKVFADQSPLLDDLEMTETDLKIDDWMMINKVHNNLKKYNKLKQLTTFKLKMLEFRWYL